MEPDTYELEYIIAQCRECYHVFLMTGNPQAASLGYDPYKDWLCEHCGEGNWKQLRKGRVRVAGRNPFGW